MFQKLFAEAIAKFGVSVMIPTHRDTSEIDEIEQGDKNLGLVSAEPEIVKLRSVVRHITADVPHTSNIFKNYKSSRVTSSNKMASHLYGDSFAGQKRKEVEFHSAVGVVEYNWQGEVELMMQSDMVSTDIEEMDDDEQEPAIKKSRLSENEENVVDVPTTLPPTNSNWLKAPRKLPSEISPYFCFEPDAVDINETYDELNVLLPNVELDNNDNEGNDNVGLSALQKPHLDSQSSLESDYFFLVKLPKPSDAPPADVMLTTADRMKEKERQKAERIRKLGHSLNDIAEDVERSFVDKKQQQSQLQRKRTRSLIAATNHAQEALQHTNTQPDLKEVDLRFFHRSRGKMKDIKEYTISIKPINFKNSKDAGRVSQKNRLQTYEKERKNLSLVQGDFVLIEYIEEMPPVILNFGMASAIKNYYRPKENEVYNI